MSNSINRFYEIAKKTNQARDKTKFDRFALSLLHETDCTINQNKIELLIFVVHQPLHKFALKYDYHEKRNKSTADNEK